MIHKIFFLLLSKKKNNKKIEKNNQIRSNIKLPSIKTDVIISNYSIELLVSMTTSTS